jgi:hypothetical protein
MAGKNHYIIRLQDNIHRMDGPFSEETIHEGLISGTFSWADFLVFADDPKPVRLFDAEVFESAMPTIPSKAILETFITRITGRKEKADTKYPDDMGWLIQISGSEFGPFPPSKLIEMLGKYRKLGDIYVWRQGIPNWTFAASLEDLNRIFHEFYSGIRNAVEEPLEVEKHKNQRASARVGAIATVAEISPHGKRNVLGVCGNLSVSGLLLLHKDTSSPLQKGQTLIIEIQPLAASGLKPIQTEAVAQWVSERKSGLLFTKTSSEAKKCLEEYFVSKFWAKN